MKDTQSTYIEKRIKPCFLRVMFILLAAFMQPTAIAAIIVDDSTSTSGNSAGKNVPDYLATVTAVSGLNVRSGPGANYRRISKLRYGSTVKVTHHYGSWSKIYLGPSKSAYVSNRYLSANRTGTSSTPVNSQSSKPSSTTSGQPNSNERNVTNYYAIVTASALNIRSGPGITHGIIGKRYRNSSVVVTHHNGIWRKLAWSQGSSAYVHRDYLRKRDTSSRLSKLNASLDTGSDPEVLNTQPTNLNSSSADRARLIAINSELTQTSSSTKVACKLQVPRQKSYSTKYLSRAITTTQMFNQASSRCPHSGKWLVRGSPVRVIAKNGSWFFIQNTSNRRYGWVPGSKIVKRRVITETSTTDSELSDEQPVPSGENPIPVREQIITNLDRYSLLLDRGGSSSRYKVIEYSDGSKTLLDTEGTVDGKGLSLALGIDLKAIGIEVAADFEFIKQSGKGKAYKLYPGWEDELEEVVRRKLAIYRFRHSEEELAGLFGSPEAYRKYSTGQAFQEAAWEASFDDVLTVQTYDYDVNVGVSGEATFSQVLGVELDQKAGVGKHQEIITDNDTGASSHKMSLTQEAAAGIGIVFVAAGLEGEIRSEQALTIHTNEQGELDTFDLEFAIAVDGSESGINPFAGIDDTVNVFLEPLVEELVSTPFVDILNLDIDSSHADGYELRITASVPDNNEEVSLAVEEFIENPSAENARGLQYASGGALPTVSVAVYSIDKDTESFSAKIAVGGELGVSEQNTTITRELIKGVIISTDGVEMVSSDGSSQAPDLPDTNTSENSNTDDDQRQKEYEAYKAVCDKPIPPEIRGDKCEEAKFKLQRNTQCRDMRIKWDKKWAPGRHHNDIANLNRAIKKNKQDIERYCNE